MPVVMDNLLENFFNNANFGADFWNLSLSLSLSLSLTRAHIIKRISRTAAIQRIFLPSFLSLSVAVVSKEQRSTAVRNFLRS